MPKRPFSTQKDGDLWELFYNCMRHKGPVSFNASKVKGHATHGMVEAGLVSETDKVGNDMADHVADEGVELHGQSVIQTGARLTQRHVRYGRFIKVLHDHILEAYHRKRYLEKAIEDLQEKPKEPGSQETREDRTGRSKHKIRFVVFSMPTYSDGQGMKHFEEMTDLKFYGSTVSKYRNAVQVQDFFKAVQLHTL